MEVIAIFLALGVIAGFIGGLFGLGGGVVIVPMLIVAFELQGFDQDVLTHMAIGTSLATIVVTSVSATWVHHKRGAVLWPVFKGLAPGIAIGALLGGVLAAALSGLMLQLFFGLLLIGVALQTLAGLRPGGSRELLGRGGLAAVGGVFGALSALFGIGGGSLTTPFLLWCNVSMHRAIATSAACGLPIGLFAAMSYIGGGWEESLPKGSLGYVYLPALLGIGITTLFSVRWGAALAHMLPAAKLKRWFALFILVLGVRFVWVNVMKIMGLENGG